MKRNVVEDKIRERKEVVNRMKTVIKVEDNIRKRKALNPVKRIGEKLRKQERSYGHREYSSRLNLDGVTEEMREIKLKTRSAKLDRWGKYYSMCSSFKPLLQEFLIDSGASNHMCGNKNLFENLQYGNYGDISTASKVKLAD